jgi:hypothetical protein
VVVVVIRMMMMMMMKTALLSGCFFLDKYSAELRHFVIFSLPWLCPKFSSHAPHALYMRKIVSIVKAAGTSSNCLCTITKRHGQVDATPAQ